MNLYHVTKFSPYFSFTVYCFYTKISSFTPALSIRIALDCFYRLIFYCEKFSTDVCRLPYAVNVNLNLSLDGPITVVMKHIDLLKAKSRHCLLIFRAPEISLNPDGSSCDEKLCSTRSSLEFQLSRTGPREPLLSESKRQPKYSVFEA